MLHMLDTSLVGILTPYISSIQLMICSQYVSWKVLTSIKCFSQIPNKSELAERYEYYVSL